jgi:hypothetical protein
MTELTADLRWIAAELDAAVRSDLERGARRRARLRTAASVVGATMALSGTAVATAQLTGAIDLGGGRSAQPVHRSLGAGDPNLPYRYRISGQDAGRDGTGPIYLESTTALPTNADGTVDIDALSKARHGCMKHSTTVGDAYIWVLDGTCQAGRP